MSGEIDGSFGEMNIHQIVNDPALNVAFMFVDQNFFSGIEDF